MQAESDQDLLLYMAAGRDDEKKLAFHEFYRRYLPFVLPRVRRIGAQHKLSGQDIDGLSVDILIKVFHNADKFEPPDTVPPDEMTYAIKGWVGAIANNHIIDQLRCCETEGYNVPLDGLPESEIATWAEHDAPTVEQDSPALKLLHEALNALSEDDQTILRMYFANQDPSRLGRRGRQGDTQEIAEIFGTTPANIRQRVSRAKRKIREYMESAGHKRSA